MGLNLSLVSSDSESNGNPTSPITPSSSVYRHSRSISERTDSSQRCRNPGLRPDTNVPSEAGCNDSSTQGLDALLREVDETSDDVNVLRLLCSYHTRPSQLANSAGRSNSLDVPDNEERTNGEHPITSLAEATTSQTVRSANASRTRHSRHRNSLLGLDGEPNFLSNRVRARRARRAETFGSSRASYWDSSDSDSDDGHDLNNLRLSSLMLRHFQLSNASGRSRQLSVPQTDSDLLRTLRSSAARISYNVDRLTQNQGECCICLEDLSEGDVIARLPCLCIYHKKCIDTWFQRRPVCPEHPGD